MTIYEKIRELMDSDTEPMEDINEDLQNLYILSNKKERKIIDKVIRLLCGYSLESILKIGS